MISRIRMRIFIPMLFLILLFPLLSWGIFFVCLGLVYEPAFQTESGGDDGPDTDCGGPALQRG